MTNRLSLLLLLLLPLGVLAQPPESIPNPIETRNSWFSDTVGILNPKSVEVLDVELDALERLNGCQVAVVTVKQTPGYTPKLYATRLFNLWGVGEEGKDNGVLILVVTGARRIEIEVGRGANQVLTNAKCATLLKNEVVPEFKKGNYNKGVVKAVRGVIKMLRPIQQKPQAAKAPSSQTRRAVHPIDPNAGRMEVNWKLWLGGGAGGLLGLFGGLTWLRRYLRNRPRKCIKCKAQMVRLRETVEDSELDRGQLAEEELESVDYDVWVCNSCGEKRVLSYGGKYSGDYEECSKCGYKTLEVNYETIREATTSHEGRERRSERCHNCPWSLSRSYSTPRLEEDDSESGFGGGSSQGGGAGASW